MNNRLRLARKTLKFTQTEFAKELGFNKDTISNYESGRREITDEFISAFVTRFSISRNWLLYGFGDMFDGFFSDDSSTSSNLGEQLIKIRDALNIQQSEFAFALGISSYILDQYEKGNKPILENLVTQLHELYDVNLQWLFGYDNEMFCDNKEIQEARRTRANRFRMIRESLKISAQDMAKKMKCTVQDVADYEAGAKELNESQLILISKSFKINIEWLRKGMTKTFEKRVHANPFGYNNESIIVLREKLGLSHARFGFVIGCSEYVVDNYELNIADVPEKALSIICDVYDVNREWLQFGMGDMFLNTPEYQEAALTRSSRLQEAREMSKMSKQSLAKKLDCTVRELVDYELGNSELSESMMVDICRFTRVRLEWLRNNHEPKFEGFKYYSESVPDNEDEYMIPHYDDSNNTKKNYIVSSGLLNVTHVDNNYFMTAGSDSMAPIIKPSDILLIDKCYDPQNIYGIYHINIYGKVLLSRLHQMDDSIMVTFDSMKYDEAIVSEEEIEIIGKVKSIIRNL